MNTEDYIKITLDEEDIKTAIHDYLARRGYIINNNTIELECEIDRYYDDKTIYAIAKGIKQPFQW